MKAGFLDASAAPSATSPTSLEEQLASVIKQAADLRLRDAPEEQPYVHRYEERELLQKLSTQAAANAAAAEDAERARAAVVGGVADGLLGQNFMDTEEPGSARRNASIVGSFLSALADERTRIMPVDKTVTHAACSLAAGKLRGGSEAIAHGQCAPHRARLR